MYEIIHDIIADEIIQREFTPEEIAAAEKAKAEDDARQAKRDAEQTENNAARQAVLDKLGLTADEVTALLN